MELPATHHVRVAPDDPRLIIKRFSPTSHQAPEREWRALCLLHRHAPGLAPEPVRADLSADPPTVVMTKLPGASLRGASLRADQLDALGQALERLHTSISRRTVEGFDRAGGGSSIDIRALRHRIEESAHLSDESVVREALAHGGKWLALPEAERLSQSEGSPVFARADHNLSNFLMEGGCVRLVDFEYSGRGDRAGEFAELVEHISARSTPDESWTAFLSRCDLDAAERRRLKGLRRIGAIWWLLILLPGQPGHAMNPPGTILRQAERVLSL